MDAIINFWYTIVGVVKTMTISDIFDIVIVTFLVYSLIKLVQQTRAAQLIKGILVLSAAYFLAEILHFNTLSFIMRNIFQFGVLALIVVFQPELRRALEQVGRTKIRSIRFFGITSTYDNSKRETEEMILEVADATEKMAGTKTGALIVLEKTTKLGEVISTGTIVDAKPSAALIGGIFFPNSPLHDGAMVIRDARIYAAGCFLPLSDTNRISKDLGTRHRAAIGMSEVSDAVVVVVSEETGTISVAMEGTLMRGYDKHSLIRLLADELMPFDEKDKEAKEAADEQ